MVRGPMIDLEEELSARLMRQLSRTLKKSDYVKKAKKQEGSSSIKYIKYPTQFIAEEGLELERMPCITIPVP